MIAPIVSERCRTTAPSRVTKVQCSPPRGQASESERQPATSKRARIPSSACGGTARSHRTGTRPQRRRARYPTRKPGPFGATRPTSRPGTSPCSWSRPASSPAWRCTSATVARREDEATSGRSGWSAWRRSKAARIGSRNTPRVYLSTRRARGSAVLRRPFRRSMSDLDRHLRFRLRRRRRRSRRSLRGDRPGPEGPPCRALREGALSALPHRRVAAGDRERGLRDPRGGRAGGGGQLSEEMGGAPADLQRRGRPRGRLRRLARDRPAADLPGLPRRVRPHPARARARAGSRDLRRPPGRRLRLRFRRRRDRGRAGAGSAGASRRTVRVRAVVDATGRQGLLARKFALRSRRTEARQRRGLLAFRGRAPPRGRPAERHPYRRPRRRRLVLADTDQRPS